MLINSYAAAKLQQPRPSCYGPTTNQGKLGIVRVDSIATKKWSLIKLSRMLDILCSQDFDVFSFCLEITTFAVAIWTSNIDFRAIIACEGWEKRVVFTTNVLCECVNLLAFFHRILFCLIVCRYACRCNENIA